jgi:hypothetical protein
MCTGQSGLNRESAISASVTVIAPPRRVATCAKGISSMRSAAVRIMTSPVPPSSGDCGQVPAQLHYLSWEAKVDSQVAAPAETRTPNWH